MGRSVTIQVFEAGYSAVDGLFVGTDVGASDGVGVCTFVIGSCLGTAGPFVVGAAVGAGGSVSVGVVGAVTTFAGDLGSLGQPRFTSLFHVV